MTKSQLKIELESAPWLTAKSLIAVFDALEAAGGEVRVNGGAVRNALMGIEVGDVDLSTTLLPKQTIKALGDAGIKNIPTGLDHGTITAVSDHVPYEITTLREDIETDGRHAVVRFGTNWLMDAQRRDLTINALYCDRHGILFDPLNGIEDLEPRIIRFIGDAEERITEDHLRILRFFRFFGWYGSGRPDASGLKACAKLKAGLEKISAERIWSEFGKLLRAPDPSRALLWMRTTGVLTAILPESEKWGIDLIPHLMAAEERWGWQADPILRLQAMVRPDGENVTNIARCLRLSNAEGGRLTAWALAKAPDEAPEEKELSATLYFGDQAAVVDRYKLELARRIMIGDGEKASAAKLAERCKFAIHWQRPSLPIKGEDLLQLGMLAGPEIGKKLKALEKTWVESGFNMTRSDLLAKL